MAISVSVQGDMASLIADLRNTRQAVIDKALPFALNKTMDQVKTASARQVKDVGYNLKVSDIKKSLVQQRARPGALTASVTASGRPVPLGRYGARQTKKGVSVQVLNGRKVISHAFIATMPNGHKGVFVRVGKGHKKVKKAGRVIMSGLPIKELFGPSLADAFANKQVQDVIAKLIADKFPELLRAQIKRFTK